MELVEDGTQPRAVLVQEFRVGEAWSGDFRRGDIRQLGPVSGSIAVGGTIIPAGETRPVPVTLDLRIREQQARG